jgi:predicted type IV restriction endonuclease
MDEPNRMDKKPFFTFDLQSYTESEVSDLARFQKTTFSISAIREAASNLRFAKAAAGYIKKQLEAPDDDFVRLIGKQIVDGSLTKAVMEPLRLAVQGALDLVIRDRIQDKLSVAFRTDIPAENASANAKTDAADAVDVITTDEESQAFMIVRAIAAKNIDIERITLRDAKSYCSVFVDDNNRKPVCRLYFNGKSTKFLGLFDENKVELKEPIERLSDIYKFSDMIERAVKAYV